MKRINPVITTFCILAFALFSGIQGQAYVVWGKWASNSVVFYMNPQNGDVAADAAEAAFRTSINEWNTRGGSPFRFNYAGRVGDTTTAYDGRNVAIFRAGGDGSEIARTYAWSSGGSIVDADIVFWDVFTFFSGTAGCVSDPSYGVYIEDVATHELGHALGLHHSGVGTATMVAGYPACSDWQRSLDPDDIAGVQSLYGTSSTVTQTAPTVTISTPVNGASATFGQSVSFSGSASDKEDGAISSQLTWTSSIDGVIGGGASFSRALSAGSHVVTATATDSSGLKASKQVSLTVNEVQNTAPVVSISSPTMTSFASGAVISFAGAANDSQDGNLSAALIWTSNLVGQIGLGGSFSTTLPVGTHTITASVTGRGGLVGTKQLVASVAVANTAPTITISSPGSGTFASTSAISFAASASDSQEGNLSSRIAWSSNLVGQFATGASFSMTLPAGSHVITAKVTDSGGLTATQQVSIVVSAPVSSTVGGATLSGTGYKVKGFQRAELSWRGFATTMVDVYRNGSRISTVTNSGAWTDAINNKGGGSYRYKTCEAGTGTCSNEVTVAF